MELFIFGILFATIITPILDSIASVIITGLEVIKGKLAYKVSQYNYYISTIGDDEPAMNPIGFITPKEKEDENND